MSTKTPNKLTTKKPAVSSAPVELMAEVGATGTIIFNGVIGENGEYLSDFRPSQQQRQLIEKMRRSDGQVKAGLLALTLPLHSGHWDILPASTSAKDLEVAAFVKDNLFNGMSTTWDDFLYHVLLMLPFGFSVFEKVWKLENGQYKWAKLAPRLPRTIYRWFVEDDGSLDYVQQWAWKQGTYHLVDIAGDRLLVFTYEKEGSNYEGVSCLRAAYKHWYYKNTLYAIDGIASERHGVGVPYFTFPKTATADQVKKIDDIGQRMHAHERGYVALPDGMTFDLKGVNGQLHDIHSSIEHHDTQILRSVLAQFVALGGGKGAGSYALSADQSAFFLMALQSTGRNICDTLNPAIRELVDYNYNVDAYPKATVSDLNYVEVDKLALALSQLTTAGLITNDEAIETELRRLMHLPMKTAASAPIAKPGQPPQAPGQPAKPNGQGQPPKPPAANSEPTGKGGKAEDTLEADTNPVANDTNSSIKLIDKVMTDAEKSVSFNEMTAKLDSVEQRLVDVASKIQGKQIRQVVRMAVDDIGARDMQKLSAIDVPYRIEMARALTDQLTTLYDFGRQQVVNEAGRQGVRAAVKLTDPTPQELIQLRAVAMANVLAAKLKSALAWQALNQMQGGTIDAEALTVTLTSLSDRELDDMAKTSSGEALNFGRQAQANQMQDSITNVTSSAIMDKNTCKYCQGLEGKSWQMGDEPANEPPYDDCEGQDRCRCIWVYTFKSEV